MKKVVVKVEFYDDKIKKKAMQSVSGLSGVESVSVDMKDQKMTLIGDIDPVQVVCKLRKLCHAEILSVGPAKEEKKKEEPKKEPEKKPEDKKKEELDALVKAYEASKYKPPNPKAEISDLMKTYQDYFNQIRQPNPYYYPRTMEERPSACAIC